jgi:hypothetical protein
VGRYSSNVDVFNLWLSIAAFRIPCGAPYPLEAVIGRVGDALSDFEFAGARSLAVFEGSEGLFSLSNFPIGQDRYDLLP